VCSYIYSIKQVAFKKIDPFTFIKWIMLSTNTLFVVEVVIDAIVPLVQSQFTKNKEAIQPVLILGFGALMLCSVICNLEYARCTSKESNENKRDFIKQSLEQYSMLSQSDRESASVDVFKRVQGKKEGTVGIQSFFKMSLKSLASMLMSLLSTMYIIWSIWPLVYLAVLYALSYGLIRDQMKKSKELRTQHREAENRYKKQDDFQYQKIRIGQGSIDAILERREKLNAIKNMMEHEWNKLFLICSAPIVASVVLSLFHQRDNHINLVILCTMMLKSIRFVTAFFSTYEDTLAKREEYEKYWQGKEYTVLPPQYPIETLNIIKYQFKGKEMQFSAPLVLKQGDIVRVTGETGSGKTTFINALKGVRNGMLLSKHEPLNHFTYISHLRQDIRGAYCFSNISLAELFETDNEREVLEVLEVVYLLEWYEEIGGDIYADINNRVSGGQKTQLCLAITIAEGIRKQLLILDEPEQGLHPELVPHIIGNVFAWLREKNPNLIIVSVSHVCECIVRQLPLHKHWHITRTKTELKLDVS
jgi:ABC-type transport system involved in cytochrome bd biosynthesis fused ATPase/permease subunit